MKTRTMSLDEARKTIRQSPAIENMLRTQGVTDEQLTEFLTRLARSDYNEVAIEKNLLSNESDVAQSICIWRYEMRPIDTAFDEEEKAKAEESACLGKAYNNYYDGLGKLLDRTGGSDDPGTISIFDVTRAGCTASWQESVVTALAQKLS